MAQALMSENVWLHQQRFEDAERLYRQLQAGTATTTTNDKSKASSLVGELTQVRQDIQKALNKPPVGAGAGGAGDASVYKRLDALERENKELKKLTDDLQSQLFNLEIVVGTRSPPSPTTTAPSKPASKPAAADDDDDDDDDIDLFGEEDEEEAKAAEELKQRRVKEYAERKAKKPTVIAKSNVVLDVKPWDDETDMKVVEANVRTIKMDGLVWGAGKLQEVGYGIKKLVISCVVEDEKVGIDDLSELICSDEDNVQSVDIAAFNKV